MNYESSGEGTSGAASLELLARDEAQAQKALVRVRPTILKSWRRCRDWQIESKPFEPRFTDELSSTLLTDMGESEFARLTDALADEPAAVLLTAADGVVLARHSGDRTLARRLDKVNLAPGFSYHESEVGTNGIGTALQHGTSMQVHGGEHYVENLASFSCAGVPVIHPLSKKLLGVLDITLDARHANSLVLAIAKQMSARLQDLLLDLSPNSDRSLFYEFQRAEMQGMPLMAIGESFTALSSATQESFSVTDQTSLLEHARDHSEPGTSILELPSGRVVRLDTRSAESTGLLVRIQSQSQTSRPAPSGPPVPGLAGNSIPWRRIVDRALEIRRRDAWLMVEGERGSGKMALLQAVERAHAPSSLPLVVDAASPGATEAVLNALDDQRTVLLRNAERLSPDDVEHLGAELQEYGGDATGGFLAVTVTPPISDHLMTSLMPFIAHTLRLPPLRHHMEDLPAIVRHLLDRHRSDLRFSTAALAQLSRLPWPGNVAELEDVLLKVMRTQRSGTVELEDLPGQCRATARRQLTTMEWLERDAIVRALDEQSGNKQRAAESLGMSRATIYRKIREYGIS
ncbi:sigma-54-dependent Fis family transcriptional regulator [Enemella sp. A6]|uniref:sigma-54-dependent Fis family transcriptional regulator n=1 Tax=Enemella sp. A6 TaxID=3440152 RepID=UPI003EBD36F8